MTHPDHPPMTPTIPTPGRIVADVGAASVVLLAFAAPGHTPAQWAAVVAGGLVAVLIAAGMAWAVVGEPAWLRVRLLLQSVGAGALFWALVASFPPGPALLGFMALVLGIAGRALICAVAYRRVVILGERREVA